MDSVNLSEDLNRQAALGEIAALWKRLRTSRKPDIQALTVHLLQRAHILAAGGALHPIAPELLMKLASKPLGPHPMAGVLERWADEEEALLEDGTEPVTFKTITDVLWMVEALKHELRNLASQQGTAKSRRRPGSLRWQLIIGALVRARGQAEGLLEVYYDG